MDFNQLLFYGGLVITGLAAIFSIVLTVFFYIIKIKLNYKLDEEYGKQLDIEKTLNTQR